MRAGLALLPFEPALVRSALLNWMLEVRDPAMLLVIRDALVPYAEELTDNLWWQLDQAETKPAQRLRSGSYACPCPCPYAIPPCRQTRLVQA